MIRNIRQLAARIKPPTFIQPPHNLNSALLAPLSTTEDLLPSATSSDLERLLHPHQGGLPLQTFVRNFQGSSREKRLRKEKEAKKLEKELYKEYQIGSLPKVSHSNWLKKFYGKELVAFQSRLSVRFEDESLLRSAFIHSSFLEEMEITPEPVAERDTAEDILNGLRFDLLSKANSAYNQQALQLIGYTVASHSSRAALFQRYPHITVSLCDAVIEKLLLSRATTNALSRNLDITDFILTSSQLEVNQESVDYDQPIFTRDQEDIVSDTFFALVGAIHVDLGASAADKFMDNIVLALIDYEDLAACAPLTVSQARRELIKILQATGVSTLNLDPRTLSHTGHNSDFPHFRVAIFCNGRKLGEGSSYHLEDFSSFVSRERYDTVTDGAIARAYQNCIFEILEGNIDLESFKSEPVLLEAEG